VALRRQRAYQRRGDDRFKSCLMNYRALHSTPDCGGNSIRTKLASINKPVQVASKLKRRNFGALREHKVLDQGSAESYDTNRPFRPAICPIRASRWTLVQAMLSCTRRLTHSHLTQQSQQRAHASEKLRIAPCTLRPVRSTSRMRSATAAGYMGPAEGRMLHDSARSDNRLYP